MGFSTEPMDGSAKLTIAVLGGYGVLTISALLPSTQVSACESKSTNDSPFAIGWNPMAEILCRAMVETLSRTIDTLRHEISLPRFLDRKHLRFEDWVLAYDVASCCTSTTSGGELPAMLPAKLETVASNVAILCLLALLSWLPLNASDFLRLYSRI